MSATFAAEKHQHSTVIPKITNYKRVVKWNGFIFSIFVYTYKKQGKIHFR